MSGPKLPQLKPFTPKHFGMNRITLNFEPELEKQFRDHYIHANYPYLKVACIVATLIYVSAMISQLVFTPWEVLKCIWTYSLGIVLPIQLFCVMMAFSSKGKKYILRLFELAFISVAIGMTYECIYIRPDNDIPIEILHLVVMFAVLTFVRFRFIQSLKVAIIILTLLFVGLYFKGVSQSRFIFDLIFSFAALFFGAFASYALEYFSRRNWMLSLNAEREKQLEIEAANLRSTQELARAVAHEFNNPLAILNMMFELYVEPEFVKKSEEEQKNYEKIPRTIQRMSDLVNKLLSLTELKSADYVEGVQYLNIKESSK